MNLLIDTHIFIWMALEPARLPTTLRAGLEESSHQIVLSTASLWEMQIKYQTGRLNLPAPAQVFVEMQVLLRDIQILPVYPQHVWAVDALPYHHRDPFDRLLIAQAIVEGYSLASADAVFQQYPVALFR
jgi:PIN domain nuclease of toxin-antitoxin system